MKEGIKKINSKWIIMLITTLLSIAIVILLSLEISLQIDLKNSLSSITLLSILFIILIICYASFLVIFFKNNLNSNASLMKSINSVEYSKEEIFEVGIIVFNKEKIVSFISPWMQNEGFNKYLGHHISKIGINMKDDISQKIKINSRIWDIKISFKNRILFLKDITNEITLKKVINLYRNSVISFHVSFSKKINFDDYKKTEVTIKINQAISDWARKYNGIVNSSVFIENTSTIIARWSNVEKNIITNTLLNNIKKSLGKNNQKDVIISIGVSYGNFEPIELFRNSIRALEISKNRGGDQIVLDTPKGELIYIGYSSLNTQSSSILKIKKFQIELMEDIKFSREIFITSHNIADLDAIASALGFFELIKKININIKIVLNKFDSTAQKLFNNLSPSFKKIFIDEKRALKLMTNRSHIVILDALLPKNTQAKELINKISKEKVSIIDHHRMSWNTSDFSESKILIEPSISSTSEIIVEMFKINTLNNSQKNLSSEISTALFAGIKLDSKQLTKNTTNSTFDAISFLISNGANIMKAQELFNPNQNLIKIEKEFLKNIWRPVKGIVCSFIPEKIIIDNAEISILADKLLSYNGVEASLILARTNDNKFKLSIRSNEKINSQLIAESLGGGGHFNSAAVTWPISTNFNTIKKRINTAINKGVRGLKGFK